MYANERVGIPVLQTLSRTPDLRMAGAAYTSSPRDVEHFYQASGPSRTGCNVRYGGKRRCRASAQAERQIRATNVCTRKLETHSSSACAVPYNGKVSERKDKSPKWLHPASLSMKTII